METGTPAENTKRPPPPKWPQVQPKLVLLIFVSGKVVLTGAKVRETLPRKRTTNEALQPSRHKVNTKTERGTHAPPPLQTKVDIIQAFENIYPVLSEYKKDAAHPVANRF